MKFITTFCAMLSVKIVWRFRKQLIISLIALSGYLGAIVKNPQRELANFNKRANQNSIVYRKKLTYLSRFLCKNFYGKKLLGTKFVKPDGCLTEGEY